MPIHQKTQNPFIAELAISLRIEAHTYIHTYIQLFKKYCIILYKYLACCGNKYIFSIGKNKFDNLCHLAIDTKRTGLQTCLAEV